MSDLSSSLNTGVTSAYFKPFGYCELDNALLKLLYTKYEIKSLFSLIILISMFSLWEAFLTLNLLTSLIVSSNETNSKAKPGHHILSVFLWIERMLKWFLNFLTAVETVFWEQAITGSLGTFWSHKHWITLWSSHLIFQLFEDLQLWFFHLPLN